MRALAIVLLTLIGLTTHAAAQNQIAARSSGPPSLSVQNGDIRLGEARPASAIASGTMRPSCSGAWIEGCLENGAQRALLLLGIMSGMSRPGGLR